MIVGVEHTVSEQDPPRHQAATQQYRKVTSTSITCPSCPRPAWIISTIYQVWQLVSDNWPIEEEKQ